MTEDRRRRQYVPLSVHFAAGHTGQEIQRRLGLEGLGAWACLLAAAKRAHTQGELEWVTENEAWRHLLGPGKPPESFTFAEFVAVLGRLHLTRTTKRGEVKTTSIRAWNEWNTTLLRSQDAEKKRRKRAHFARDKATTSSGTEGEYEYEREKTSGKDKRSKPTTSLPCPICGASQDNKSMLEDHLTWAHHIDPAEVAA